MQSLSSKLLEKAVEQFASLPGIGRKTALRYVLHMLRQSPEEVKQFTDSIIAMFGGTVNKETFHHSQQHYRLKRIHQRMSTLPQHFRQ